MIIDHLGNLINQSIFFFVLSNRTLRRRNLHQNSPNNNEDGSIYSTQSIPAAQFANPPNAPLPFSSIFNLLSTEEFIAELTKMTDPQVLSKEWRKRYRMMYGESKYFSSTTKQNSGNKKRGNNIKIAVKNRKGNYYSGSSESEKEEHGESSSSNEESYENIHSDEEDETTSTIWSDWKQHSRATTPMLVNNSRVCFSIYIIIYNQSAYRKKDSIKRTTILFSLDSHHRSEGSSTQI